MTSKIKTLSAVAIVGGAIGGGVWLYTAEDARLFSAVRFGGRYIHAVSADGAVLSLGQSTEGGTTNGARVRCPERMLVSANWNAEDLLELTCIPAPEEPPPSEPPPSEPPPTEPPPTEPPPSEPPPSEPPPGGMPVLVGYGSVTKGGATPLPSKTPEVFEITSLARKGRGTLDECVNGPGIVPRTCVYKVGGKIRFTPADGTLTIRRPYLTVNAWTAPAPGITIEKTDKCFNGVKVGATHDVIFVGHRLADSWRWEQGNPIQPNPACPDVNNAAVLVVDGDTAPVAFPWDPNPNPNPRGVYRSVIAHNTLRGGIDSNSDLYGVIIDSTYQGNLALDNWHATSITGKVATKPMTRVRVSGAYNVYTRTGERQPQFARDVEEFDWRFNIVHGWGQPKNADGSVGGGYGLRFKGDDAKSDPHGTTPVNVVGNAFLVNSAAPFLNAKGEVIYPASDPDKGCMFGALPSNKDAGDDSWIATFALHFAGNLFPLGRKFPDGNCKSTKTGQQPFPVPPYAAIPPVEFEDIAAKVGMPYRDAEEQAAIDQLLADLQKRLAAQPR